MGLFTFLKNGITLEKRKQADEETYDAADDTTMADTPPEEVAQAPTEIPTEQKELANAILYGRPMPTPTPAAAPQPTELVTTFAEPATPHAPTPTYNSYGGMSSGFATALSGHTVANQNLLVVSPKEALDISAILSNLASGNACIVSLSEINDAQRHLDYICGFMNAIGGTIMQRTPTEYVLTPKGVGIKS